MLCSPRERWPIGWGLYFSTDRVIAHSSSFELEPKFNPENGEILGLGLKFNGVEMCFLMGNPDTPKTYGVRRPKRMVFTKEKTTSEILLDWQSKKSNKEISYMYHGKYSGLTPNPKLLQG